MTSVTQAFPGFVSPDVPPCSIPSLSHAGTRSPHRPCTVLQDIAIGLPNGGLEGDLVRGMAGARPPSIRSRHGSPGSPTGMVRRTDPAGVTSGPVADLARPPGHPTSWLTMGGRREASGAFLPAPRKRAPRCDGPTLVSSTAAKDRGAVAVVDMEDSEFLPA